MTTFKRFEKALQASILFLCLLVVFGQLPETCVEAQGCNNQPPLSDIDYPLNQAWKINSGAKAVKIEIISGEAHSSDFGYIDQGIRKWNSEKTLNCSGVEFDEATSFTAPWPTGTPSEGNVWVKREPSTVNPEGGVVCHKKVNPNGPGQWVASATISIHPDVTNSYDGGNELIYLGTHEIGHCYGLMNADASAASIMGRPNNPTAKAGGPMSCDRTQIKKVYCPSPTPTPTPTPPLCEYGFCDYPFEEWSWEQCACIPTYCPIVVDVAGNGFELTNAQNGVSFDFRGDGMPEVLSWTTSNSDDSWLVLDRNGNGSIDNGSELFGNAAPQPTPPVGITRNGFLALAEYDKFINGGNNDGLITVQDSIFGSLRLWQDSNHNGVSESSELKTLSQLGLREIDLKYMESKQTDRYGNRFKYRAKVKDIHGAQLGRWAWDVFLVSQP